MLEIIDGGAIFPTGRSIELSPEKENLIEGLGAIELRALYAGEIRIRASAEGLRPAELSLTAIGSEAWSGQKITYPSGPPSVLIPHNDSGPINIAKNRPVFCSSFAEGFSPKFINDENLQTYWRAATNEPGEWVRQDLEGLKKVRQLKVTFNVTTDSPIELSATDDGTTYELLARTIISAEHQEYSLDLQGRNLRSIKISFPELPMDIRELEIYE